MSKAKTLTSFPSLYNSDTAGTIDSKGERVPYSGTSSPTYFYFDGSLYEIAPRFYDIISGESKVLGPLFGCSVDGLTCTVTVSGYVESVPAPPPEYKAPTKEALEAKTFGFKLVRYSAGDWVINGESETEHFASGGDYKTLGGARKPITYSWDTSRFIRWVHHVNSISCPLIDSDEHPDLPAYYTIPAEDIKCRISLTLEIPAIPFDIESDFYGFPQYTLKSNPSPYVGAVWTMDSNFWGFPYIKQSGIAPPYQEDTGVYKLFFDEVAVKNLYWNGVEVKKVYFDNILVFQKGVT